MADRTGGAVVLAGGGSRRMGRDKARLPFGSGTLLEHVVARLLTLTPVVVVVAETADRYEVDGARVVGDLYPGAGPVGGIVTGLTALGDGAHVVIACDMPGVSVSVLNFLLGEAGADVDTVVPEVNGAAEPLCAAYRDSAAPKLARFLEGGGRSARAALDALTVRRVGEDALRRLDPDLLSFSNLNSPEDVERFLRLPG